MIHLRLFFTLLVSIFILSACSVKQSYDGQYMRLSGESQCTSATNCQLYFGSDGWDDGHAGVETADGGLIIAGRTEEGNTGGDALVFKLDFNNKLLWDYTYSGESSDYAKDVVETWGGNILVVGRTASLLTGGDAFALLLSSEGKPIWDYLLSGIDHDSAHAVVETPDGGFVIVGESSTRGREALWDALVFKIDKNGKLVWKKHFGEDVAARASAVTVAEDGGVVIVGEMGPRSKETGDIEFSDAWAIKLNRNGKIVWEKMYKGKKIDVAKSIIVTEDGGFIIVGTRLPDKWLGREDIWARKINSKGFVIWQTSFGLTETDEATAVTLTPDGGYLIAGATMYKESYDIRLTKVGTSGNIVWDRLFGGPGGTDVGYDVLVNKSGGITVIGKSDVSNARNEDIVILKLDKEGLLKGRN
ncbi:MAG: hypothetical protein V3T30_04295 [Thermodesulfobacteriota bacterium]